MISTSTFISLYMRFPLLQHLGMICCVVIVPHKRYESTSVVGGHDVGSFFVAPWNVPMLQRMTLAQAGQSFQSFILTIQFSTGKNFIRNTNKHSSQVVMLLLDKLPNQSSTFPLNKNGKSSQSNVVTSIGRDLHRVLASLGNILRWTTWSSDDKQWNCILSIIILISKIEKLYGYSNSHTRGEVILQGAFLLSTDDHFSSPYFSVVPMTNFFFISKSHLAILPL